jgi:hypothetical protein
MLKMALVETDYVRVGEWVGYGWTAKDTGNGMIIDIKIARDGDETLTIKPRNGKPVVKEAKNCWLTW